MQVLKVLEKFLQHLKGNELLVERMIPKDLDLFQDLDLLKS
jgi:hypothetical protein